VRAWQIVAEAVANLQVIVLTCHSVPVSLRGSVRVLDLTNPAENAAGHSLGV